MVRVVRTVFSETLDEYAEELNSTSLSNELARRIARSYNEKVGDAEAHLPVEDADLGSIK